MAFMMQREGDDVSDRSPRQSVRVTGFVLAFFAFCFLVAHGASYFREDPFQGHVLLRTKGEILSVKPGKSKETFRSYSGYYFQYQFVLGHERYMGEFFARSKRYYQVGHEINVEYCQDQPEINRWASSSNPTEAPSSLQAMSLFTIVVFVGLFIIGAVMAYTGREFRKPW